MTDVPLTIEQFLELSNEDLLALTIDMPSLTPLELELALRLETYLAMYGDFVPSVSLH
jgi:hypothetical protein